jgi:CRISPR-associated protein Cas1
VRWSGRRYNPDAWSEGDAVNRALSTANSALYGAIHAVISAMGCSPGLGFVHTGHVLSFVYDIADLYKVEVTIPASFQAAVEGEAGLSSRVRRRVRERIHDGRVMERAVNDIRYLLFGERSSASDIADVDELALWDESAGVVPSGVAYGESS